MQSAQASRLVILGGAGDLVTRHVAPALADLEERRLLPPGQIVLVDRARVGAPEFARALAASVRAQRPQLADDVLVQLLDRVVQVPADLGADTEVPALDGATYVHVALPPEAMPAAAAVLGRTRLAAGARVVVEKPYGLGPDSSASLDRMLHAVVRDEQLLRADHLLHHRAVRDLEVLREWLAPRIDNLRAIDVTWDEAATVQARGSTFDRSGALIDMVQSHLLQLVAAVLAPPVPAAEMRVARADALRRLVGEGARRAQYAGYREHNGVAPGSRTETWVRAELRWADRVPVTVETGKALRGGRRQVVLRLGSGDLVADLRGRRLSVHGSITDPPGPSPDEDDGLTASAVQLLAALSGDRSRFLSQVEVAEQWRICAEATRGWSSYGDDLEDYAPGSAGPLALEEDC